MLVLETLEKEMKKEENINHLKSHYPDTIIFNTFLSISS